MSRSHGDIVFYLCIDHIFLDIHCRMFHLCTLSKKDISNILTNIWTNNKATLFDMARASIWNQDLPKNMLNSYCNLWKLLWTCMDSFFLNYSFQYLFTKNSNRMNGGNSSTEAPLFSSHLGCQGLPGLDMLIACNKYIISIRLDQII